ncbi:kinase-like domain-containing protein [Mycotypha africana]|uniref:kinase-like domain-containing protein n=1 Tax=Mycotypha africana TaxID=64632 RepID=UPI002300A961|nr:kinase-like domain-containing protein [Mycotypha africana]KAI8988199.1 kinase-like domain-containing protein [Mycotypha africana]
MFDQIKGLFKQKKTHPKEAVTADEKQKNKDVATRIVQEEKQRKNVLPQYPGLERFEMIEKIGEGAFSFVFKARDKLTGKEVAVKVVRRRDLDASDAGKNHLHPNMKKKTKATERENILKEVQIMRNINHNNIVRLIQFSESDDYYFLVLELCHGGELFHRIVKLTYFSEDLARHVIVQVAEGIRYLHEECGVVHRDIKPENILFEPIPIIKRDHVVNPFNDEDKEDEGEFIEGVGGGGIGIVKIADFGLSKVIWDNSTLTPCGTVGYTAPEIVRDQKYSKSVDMWAIGCVLYTILCGFPPFYDESIRALTHKVARGEYTFLSPWWDPISPAAKDLISNLLTVDPEKRYTIDQFFQHPWITKSQFPPPARSSTNTLPSKPLVEKKFKANDPRAQAMQNAASKAAAAQAEQKRQDQAYNAMMAGQQPAAANVNTIPTNNDSKPAKRNDIFTPGINSIKEILDVTYAVQRMGEEKKMRTGNTPAIHTANRQNGFIPDYDSISEEDEEDEDDDTSSSSSSERASHGIQKDVIALAEQLVHDGKGIAPGAYSLKPKQTSKIHDTDVSMPVSRKKRNAFDLDLSKATLLRNRRVVA